MTEMAKTVFFLAAAGIALTLAFLLGPSDSVQNYDEQIGTRLNQFEPDIAKRLKIIKFDTETATPREFEVAETDGLWSIPSKNDYPADAVEQMAGAATCLMNREVLRVAGKNASEHKSLGVVSPNASKLDSKSEGVGTRVTITDINDKPLVDMIIGKPVKDAANQYYVRNANQDIVYVVNLNPEKLSTKFEDWIEHDLLQLNPMDILQIAIKDYSVELQRRISPQGRLETSVLWNRRSEMTLSDDQDHDQAGDQKESRWQAKSMLKFDSATKSMIPFTLTETETLNEENLTALRDGLADLLLIDVERKPAGLSDALKEGSDFYKDIDAAQSLMNRGFAPLSTGAGKPVEILSTEGEIVCTLQNGVEYVLRFGNLQIGEEEATSTETDALGEEVDVDSGINRYLFVMARLNESVIPKPEMQELPELPEAEEDANDPEGKSEEASTTDEESDEESETKAPKEDAKKTAPDELASAGGEPNKSTDAETKTARDALLAARKQIETENQRRQDEYDDQLQASKDRVQALNEHFGDWYYVISNEVYKQIHLSREQVVTLKNAQAPSAQEAPAKSLPGVPNLPFGIGAPQ